MVVRLSLLLNAMNITGDHDQIASTWGGGRGSRGDADDGCALTDDDLMRRFGSQSWSLWRCRCSPTSCGHGWILVNVHGGRLNEKGGVLVMTLMAMTVMLMLIWW